MKESILKLKKEGKTYKEIRDILNCSISTISYHCNNNGFGSKTKLSDDLVDQIKEYYKDNTIQATIKKFDVSRTTLLKYCDKKRILLTDKERRKKRVEAVVKRRRKVKQMAIDYKGGCCQIEGCGYDKYNGALEFHHLDPNEKDFSLGNKGHCTAWEKVKKELDKCILVCSNCHREIHGGLIKV